MLKMIAIVSTILKRTKAKNIPAVKSSKKLTRYQTQPLPALVMALSSIAKRMLRKWAKKEDASYFQISNRKTFQVRVSPGMNFLTEKVEMKINLRMREPIETAARVAWTIQPKMPSSSHSPYYAIAISTSWLCNKA